MIYRIIIPETIKFTHIVHIADIHIRLNKRHDEYRNIFYKLYNEIKNSPEGTLVTILGDLFNSKTDLSPECVQLATELLNNISSYRPLVLIAGNHDLNLANKDRLDSITPVVEAINNNNVHYLKEGGLYAIGNILFNNMSIFDNVDSYIRGKDIPKIYKNKYEHIVALFHGPLNGAILDMGHVITNPSINTSLFEDHDIALLGDIHKSQDFSINNKELPKIRYCGSLVQQNHGESLEGHGYSLWDLDKKIYEHHEISNEYGYFTVDIKNGKLDTNIDKIPEKCRLRIRNSGTPFSSINKILSELKTNREIDEVSYINLEANNKVDTISLSKNIVLNDLTNISYQEKLIKEFIEKKLEITDEKLINSILDINKKTNDSIKKINASNNFKWKFIKFEFDNMFSYGENNIIDFTKMHGVNGIFAPNRSGKSSILSAIIYCLFDKFDRGSRAIDVLNINKQSFRCKLEFEIDGIRYFIERIGNRNRTSNNKSVKVTVNFWRMIDGKKENLDGVERRKTNDIIRDYIGTYEDFMLTSVSVQNAKNNVSFIDLRDSERKDLLVKFIGLNIFDQLHEISNEKLKELNTLLKIHKNKNYIEDLDNNKKLLDHAESLSRELKTEIDKINTEIDNLNKEIVNQTSKINKLDNSIPNDIDLLEHNKLKIEESIKNKKNEIEKYEEKSIQIKKQIEDFTSKIELLEKLNVLENYRKYKKSLEDLNDIKNKVNIKKLDIKSKLDKVNKLKTHRYNPECEYCVNNPFVKDALKAKEELKEDKKISDGLIKELNISKEKCEELKYFDLKYEEYTSLLNDKNNINSKHSELNNRKNNLQVDLSKLDTSYNNSIKQIEIFHNNEKIIHDNAEINNNISSLKKSLINLKVNIEYKNNSFTETSNKIAIFKKEIGKINKLMKEMYELENKYNIFQKYVSLTSRDGIPYQVICNVVSQIQNEINSILIQIVKYTVELETDGKNIIPYICYDYGKWPIELSSGFERFIASVAIRVALTNISNISKNTGLFIDEGFGTVDAENMSYLNSLFSFLKEYFDFIVIISHIDSLKDSVDERIELSMNNNLSKINFI